MKVISAVGAAALLVTLAASAHAQSRTVTGTVRSHTDGQLLAGVSVRVRGAATAVQTGPGGRFTIQVPAASTDMLVLTRAGYDEASVELMGRSTIDVVLFSSVRYNQYGVPVPRLPLDAEARDGILVLESKDSEYKLWLDLRMQMDGAFFFDSTLNKLGSGAEVRRARIAFKSEFLRKWYAEIDLDFADGLAGIEDLYVAYSPTPAIRLRAGNFKEVFSTEVTTTSRYMTFMERPMATRALAPSRALGLGASYYNAYLMAAAGVHFQDVSGNAEVVTRQTNNETFGVNEGFSLTEKLVVRPFKADTVNGLHVSFATSYRTPKTDDQLGKVRFSTRELTNINRKKYLDTDRIANVHHTVLQGVDGAAYHKGFRVEGEYTQADVHRNNGLTTERFSGWWAMASAMVFGGRYRYNPEESEFTQPQLGRPWGDLEVGARFEVINLNSDVDNVMGGGAEAVTLGLNYYPNNNVKLSANYGWLNLDRWASGRGKYFVGKDALGVATKNPRLVADPSGKAGDDHHMLSVRIQVSF